MAISSLNSILLAPSPKLGLYPSSSSRALITPPRRTNPYISDQEQRSPPSPLTSKVIGRSHTFSINGDQAIEQGRITMQTRVAVRDTTPHRFQIIPLRDAKKHGHYHTEAERLSKCRKPIHLDHSFDTESPSLFKSTHLQSFHTSLPNLTDGESSATDEKLQDGPNPPKNGNKKVLRCNKHVSSDIRTRQGQDDMRSESPTTKVSSHRLNLSCSHTITPDESDLPSRHYKNTNLGTPRKSNDRKLNARHQSSSKEAGLNSGDSTHHMCNVQNERYGHMQSARSETDFALYFNNKRHAIYAGSMGLPFFESTAEPDISSPSFPGLPSTQLSSINRISPPRHCCSKAHCFEAIFGRPSKNRIPTKIGLADNQSIPRHWLTALPLEESGLRGNYVESSIPRLRPARRTSDPSMARARIMALDIVPSVRHSRVVLDLLNQLDQAIEDWTWFERESAYWIPIRSARALRF